MKRRVLKVAMLLVLAGGVLGVYFSPLRAYLTREHIHDLIGHLRGIWYGPLVLVAGYAIGCVFALPASIFVIAAGVIWGWKFGSMYAIAGGFLGAIGAYFVALFLGAIDLFYVWWCVNIATGVGVLFKRKTAGVAGTFLGVYVLVALLLAFVRSGN